MISLINKFFNRPIYIIEYRWRIENVNTLWVVYKKFNNENKRNIRLRQISTENTNLSFVEYKSLDV